MNDVRLCPSEGTLTLYPQTTNTDDRGGRLRGYVELSCTTECKLDALRVRLIGMAQTAQRPIEAWNAVGTSASPYGGAPAQTFVMREASLRRAGSEESVDSIDTLAKGKHVLAFEVQLPNDMPATQRNVFRRVYYELLLFVRGRPKKRFFSLDFTFAPVKTVIVDVHPSPIGQRGLNAVDAVMQPGDPATTQLRATLDGSNVRFGGCFHVVLHHVVTAQQPRIRVTSLVIVLEQHWSVQGQPIEATTITKQIADDSSFRDDKLESIQADVEESRSTRAHNCVRRDDDDGNDADHKPSLPPSGQSSRRASWTLDSAVQRIRYHAWFPDSRKEDATRSATDLLAPIHDWQATTPTKTTDSVRIVHSLQVKVHYTDRDGGNTREAEFSYPIVLVKESMRTDALQLPEYSTLTTTELPPPAFDTQ